MRNVHRPERRAVYTSLQLLIHQKGTKRTSTFKFINAEKAGDIFLFKYFSVDDIKKTMNVINNKSYPLSMLFTFSVLPCGSMDAQSKSINRTVPDKILILQRTTIW